MDTTLTHPYTNSIVISLNEQRTLKLFQLIADRRVCGVAQSVLAPLIYGFNKVILNNDIALTLGQHLGQHPFGWANTWWANTCLAGPTPTI